MRSRPILLLFAIGVIAAGACGKPADAPPAERKIRVAAAADLARAFTEISADFKAKTGITAEVTIGSSGLLAKQIEQGAPFSLFAAANREFADQVVKAGKCDGSTVKSYARGRVVVWTPAKVAPPKTLAD